MLIVDTIFRASRLFYSYLGVLAAKESQMNCDILVRKDYESEHFNELYQKLDNYSIIPAIDPVPNKWFFRQTFYNTLKTIIQINNLYKKNKYSRIFFPGINEFFPWLPLILIIYRAKAFRESSVIFIEYDARFLFEENLKFMHKIKRIIFNVFLICYENIKIGILDERASNSIKNRESFFLISDPSFPNEKEKRMEQYAIVMLLVGKQTKRKGFDDIINLLKTYELPDNVKFRFVGRLDSDSETYRSFISMNPTKIEFVEGFFTEDQILQEFQNADYIVLPYDTSFNSSSGVFANAMAAGKPIISTKHGCIGYRNKIFRLGYMYGSKNIDELYNTIKDVVANHKNEYSFMAENSKNYAKQNSINSFITTLNQKW